MEIKRPAAQDQRIPPIAGQRPKSHFLSAASKALVLLLVIVILAVIGLRLVFTLPDRERLGSSSAITASAETRLGATILPLMARFPGLSGVAPLVDGRDALAARVLLARSAEDSIDAQYYIWQTDTTGWLLLDEFRAAAERGVRVRLLLDDNGIPGLDDILIALDAHPDIEVRIFNPFTLRRPKLLSYAFDFPRLNHRMHNKSMTVDGAATILGGRNIGDIYFAYGEGTTYFDLDVLAVGPIARDVATDFDRYWASASAYPADLILSRSAKGGKKLVAAAAAARESMLGSAYLAAITSAPLVSQVIAGEDVLEWTSVKLVSDSPAKGLGQADQEEFLLGRLKELLTDVEGRIDLVSAYLIPGRDFTERLAALAQAGHRVRLMTNSLEATDQPIVHSAWRKYRHELVDAGVDVLELRAQPDRKEIETGTHILMGSLSSLHAKTFALDGARIFIGSFNFDPRSAALNTEMGVLIESPTMATALSAVLDRRDMVYALQRGSNGSLQWLEEVHTGEVIVHRVEPHTTRWTRGLIRVLSLLPIEWLL
jgi:cardiolipin synthase C